MTIIRTSRGCQSLLRTTQHTTGGDLTAKNVRCLLKRKHSSRINRHQGAEPARAVCQLRFCGLEFKLSLVLTFQLGSTGCLNRCCVAAGSLSFTERLTQTLLVAVRHGLGQPAPSALCSCCPCTEQCSLDHVSITMFLATVNRCHPGQTFC